MSMMPSTPWSASRIARPDVQHHLAERAVLRQVRARDLDAPRPRLAPRIPRSRCGTARAAPARRGAAPARAIQVAAVSTDTRFPRSRSFRYCSATVYQIHSVIPDSHTSAPACSRRRTASSFENVLRRQKISPTTPMSGRVGSGRVSRPMKRRRQRTSAARRAAQLCRPARSVRSPAPAHLVQALLERRVGGADPALVRAVLQQELLQDVGGHQRAPGRCGRTGAPAIPRPP